MQDERQQYNREREALLINCSHMEKQLSEVIQRMLYLMEEQQRIGVYEDQSKRLMELIESNQSKTQQIQEKEFTIADQERELKDLRKQLLSFQQQQSELYMLRNQVQKQEDCESARSLVFNYGLIPRSPKNISKANKQVQCEEFLINNNGFLMDKYDSLREEYSGLKREYDSHVSQSKKFTGEISELGSLIRQLKEVVLTKVLGGQNSKNYESNGGFKDEIEYQCQVVKQCITAIEALKEPQKSQKIKSVEEKRQLVQKVEEIQQGFTQLKDLGSQQRAFTDLLSQFFKLKNSFDFFEVKYQLLKTKYQTLQSTYAKLESSSSDTQQLLDINKQQLSQILKLKKQVQQENLKSPVRQLRESAAKSPFKEIKAQQQSSNQQSPMRQQETSKLNYLTSKVKDLERKSENHASEIKEKEFVIEKLKEEVDRKQIRINSIEGLMEDMNKKLSDQLKYIQTLENTTQEKEKRYLIETQRTLRDNEQLLKSLSLKNQELQELRRSSLQPTLIESHHSSNREHEDMQRSVELLKSQYEREKRLVEDKVRQLVELQSSSVQEKELIQENHQLKNMNGQLNQIVNEMKRQNEEANARMLVEVGKLKDKIIRIEQGCAKEIVMRLEQLRREATLKVEGKSLSNENELSVEQMIGEVMQKIEKVCKQRENLQKAVNQLQGEKQQMVTNMSISQPKMMFSTMGNRSIVAGGIARSQASLQEFPQPIASHSPNRMQRAASNKSIVYIQQPSEDPNVIEYLQAELLAVKQKKDHLSYANTQLLNQIKQLEHQLQALDLFSKKDNLDTYQQLLQYVKDILKSHKQDQLLEDIISHPLKHSDDSGFLFHENSVRLISDLEALMPLLGKCLCLLMLDKEKIQDKLRDSEHARLELERIRNQEMQRMVDRDDHDKAQIKKAEESYKQELLVLRAEKDLIVSKSKEFGKNLTALQQENEEKREQIRDLRGEIKSLREELERQERVIMERLGREADQRHMASREEAYCRGRKEATDEMVGENRKLREVIESLRMEVSQKSKKLIEMQFEMEEMNKQKKKSVMEVEELYIKLQREREGQRELQARLEQLLNEVGYLKSISKQIQ